MGYLWRFSLLAVWLCITNGTSVTVSALKEVEEATNFVNFVKETRDNFQLIMQNIHRVMSKVDELKINNDEHSTTSRAGDSGGDHYCSEATVSGVYPISSGIEQRAYCEVDQNGTNWVVIQRREEGCVNFTRTWAEYQQGFGNLAVDHWLGNDLIHNLTAAGYTRLRVDLTDKNNTMYTVHYTGFTVTGAQDKYKLSIDSFLGSDPPGDAFDYVQNAMYPIAFSTYDQENQENGPGVHCTPHEKGGWWVHHCQYANLNGEYNNDAYAEGINWVTWTGYENSLKKTAMMISQPTA